METFIAALHSAFGSGLFSAAEALRDVDKRTYPPLLVRRLGLSRFPSQSMGRFLATCPGVSKYPTPGTGKHAHLYQVSTPLL